VDRAIKNLPNALTLFRLVVIPFFVYLLYDPSRDMVYAATALFVVASITDYFDGLLARYFKVVSDTGKLLDPLADKLLVMTALVMLVSLRADVDGAPWVPAWMVVIILARELWVTGLRGIAATQGMVLSANAGGKWKNALQIFAISCLLLHYPFKILGIVVNFEAFGTNILAISIAFALWSGLDYTTEVLGKVKWT